MGLALVGALLAIAVILTVAQPTSAQTGRSSEELRVVESTGPGRPGELSAAQELAISQGYLVPDQAAYERAKAAAAARAEGQQPSVQQPSAPEALTPQQTRSWEGVRDPNVGPSDSTGAIGPDRYVELVNRRFAIYDRTSDTPMNTGTLNELAGEDPSENLFDPQVIWDPTTGRFYYVMDDIESATQNFLAWGFSKTSSPSSEADFCHYFIPYGDEFPDYPKLGDTSNHLLIGVNTFANNTSGGYVGSDLVSVNKPPAGTTCPADSAFTVNTKFTLRNANGTMAWTPVPANQTDNGTTGYVVARSNRLPAGYLSIFEVTSNPDGTLTVGAAESLAVPKYDLPANAPQRGTKKRLDALDARNTQAVSAIDPSRGTGGAVALWTQHTVFGGAGAVVRWYEIDPSDPSGPSLFQRGSVSGKRYIFNGAISPDRQTATGATGLFGDSMVLGFNSSSRKRFPDIRMVSRVGSNPVSGQVLVKASPTFLNDFTCSPSPCRWGDYSAATPDPAAPATGTHGQVWLTNQWVKKTGGSSAGWGSWNWAASP